MCICLRVCVCLTCMDVPLEDRRGHQIPRARAVGSHKLPDTGTVNWAWVLGNSSKCSWWLSHFSSPCRLDLNFYHIFIYLFIVFVYQTGLFYTCIICVCACTYFMHVCVYYSCYMQVRGQITDVSSLLPPCDQRSVLGHLTWQQVSLPTEPSPQPSKRLWKLERAWNQRHRIIFILLLSLSRGTALLETYDVSSQCFSLWQRELDLHLGSAGWLRNNLFSSSLGLISSQF